MITTYPYIGFRQNNAWDEESTVGARYIRLQSLSDVVVTATIVAKP